MALDFRASQFRGAKFISSGSTGTGAKIVFYDIAQDSTTTPNQGSLNPNLFGTGSIGTDIFLYVSGTESSGSSTSRISTFGGALFVSGALALGSKTTVDQIHISPNSKNIFVVYPSGSDFAENMTVGIASISDGSTMGQGTPSLILKGATLVASGTGGEVQIIGGGGGYKGGLNQNAAGGNITATGGAGGVIEGGGSSPASQGGAVALVGGLGGNSPNSRIAGGGGGITLTGGVGGDSVGSAGGGGGTITITGGTAGSGVDNNNGNPGSVAISAGSVVGFTTDHPLGHVTLSPTLNADYNKVGAVIIAQPVAAELRGTDEFLLVSGTVATGSLARLASFHGSVKVSGSVGFSNSIYIQSSGSDLKFWDGNNAGGLTLSQLFVTGAAATLQSAYDSGSTITLNSTRGTVKISGEPGGGVSSSFTIVPTDASYQAIDIMSGDGGNNMIHVFSGPSQIADSGIIFRSVGALSTKLIWSNTVNRLARTNGNQSEFWFSETEVAQIMDVDATDGRFIVRDGGAFGGDLFIACNAADTNNGYLYLLPAKTVGKVFNSGAFVNLGSASFAQSIFVTGTVACTNNVSATNHGTRVETVTTTNATPAIVWTFPMSASAVYDLDMTIIAAGTGSGLSKRFKRNLSTMNFSGTGSILENTVFAPVLDVSGSNVMNAIDVGFTISGANLLTTVTGVLTQSIRWTMKAEYTFGSNLN